MLMLLSACAFGPDPTGTAPLPSPSPVASAVPSPTLVPTPAPPPSSTPPPTLPPAARIEAADIALFNGDWERAVAEYQAALSLAQGEGDLALQEAARLGLGKARLWSGDSVGGVEELSAFLEAFPESGLAFEAEFLLGAAYAELGEWSQSVATYEAALQRRPGALDSYLQERIAASRLNLGDIGGAVLAYEAALAAPRAGDKLYLNERIAEAQAAAGNDEAALEKYRYVLSVAPTDQVRARMYLYIGQALIRLGQPEEAYSYFLQAVNEVPLGGDAYSALVALVNAGVTVSDLSRGLADYSAEQYNAATAAFDRHIIADPGHDATAHYYKALALRALELHGAAVAEFQSVIDTHPGDALWDDAWMELARTRWLWLEDLPGAVQTYLGFVRVAPTDPRAPEALELAGRVAERTGDLVLAAQIWARLPAEYPYSQPAANAAFLAGITLYRAGDFASAASLFEQSQAITSDAFGQSAARLWVGKCAAAQGDMASAMAAWEQAAQIDPTGYYSIRAEDLAAGRTPFWQAVAYDFSMDLSAELDAAQAWLEAAFAIASPTPLSDPGLVLTSDPRFTQGTLLWRLGEYSLAQEEFRALRQGLGADPDSLSRLAYHLRELGDYPDAIFAARQVLTLAGMGDAASLGAPAFYNYIRFGTYFQDLALPSAQAAGVEPALLFAVMRQESLFAGHATSSAQARGLMQVIPPTGAEIAADLAWVGYTDSDLFRPVVSIRFGAHYLGQQLERFDGDPYAALAAYNGGPGNSAAWRELAGGDPDLFLEVIRFPETQTYIRRIYELHTIYRSLYGR